MSKKGVVLTILDQVTSSLSNVIVMFLAAGVVSTSDFGVLSVAMLAHTTALMVSRSSLGTYVAFAAEGGLPRVRDESRYSLGLLTLAAPLSALGVLLASALSSGASHIPGFVVLVAAASPLVLMQDLLRFSASAAGRTGAALVADAVWLGMVLAIPLAAFAREGVSMSPYTLFGAWGAGAAVSLVLLSCQMRVWPSFVGLGRWVHAVGATRRRTASGAVILAVSGVGRMTFIGAATGSAVVGALSAGQLLMTPLNLLAALVPFGLAPLAARLRGSHRSRNLYLVTGLAMSATALGWGAITLAIPDALGVRLLGDSWSTAQDLIWPMAFMMSAVLLATAGLNALLSAGEARGYLRMQIMFALLSVGAAVGIARIATDASASPFAWAQAAVVWLVAAGTWIYPAAARYRTRRSSVRG